MSAQRMWLRLLIARRYPEPTDATGWPLPDVNGRDVHDIGRIRLSARADDNRRTSLRPYRVHMGYGRPRYYSDGSSGATGRERRAWTLRGARRLAERARLDPRNAEFIARESWPKLRVGTVPAGGSFAIHSTAATYAAPDAGGGG